MPGEILLCAPYVLTMDAQNTVLSDGAVLVRGNEIVSVALRDQLAREHPRAEIQEFRDSLLMPGLVNAHCHSGILRGTAEGLPVWDWLRMYIDPMHRVLNAREAETASWLCYAESALAGSTTIVDMWRYMHGSAKAADTIGTRSVLVPYVGEHPDYDYFETLESNEQLLKDWHRKSNGRINVWVGLEHLFYASPEKHRDFIDLALKYDTGFHTHSNEAEIELREMDRRYGKRSVHVLRDLGFFEPRNTLLAHCVWLDDTEIEIIAENGVGVAHNPVSNMKLASGIAPVEKLLRAGVAVGIGTDGEKENNNLDMFDDMKCTSLLGKLNNLNASALDAWEVLRMGTIDGARSIGLENEIGSLEAGKKADIIAVRTDTPRMTPLIGDGEFFNLHYNLVHSARGSDVVMTMVDGNQIVKEGRLVTADLSDMINEVHEVLPGLFERRAAFLSENTDGAVSPV
ncbi:5-methylthioadenosine/S-adenosylhomocysteine deaminase [Ruegeria denitrificans]|uniref:5-methylthioadenosine/S-adenosylhomocysteine deaminase n=1 Tax=Ruegeria denitrificans TaxID=1715692 RepID=A0A0P1IBS9_9RHOB|nr:amidohydrolase [Ruegeria denitrificans]CUK04026.1 5-methylthioadenosine/S-adenosylhomocysteine deaminase [Ruegeria denitrificans]